MSLLGGCPFCFFGGLNAGRKTCVNKLHQEFLAVFLGICFFEFLMDKKLAKQLVELAKSWQQKPCFRIGRLSASGFSGRISRTGSTILF